MNGSNCDEGGPSAERFEEERESSALAGAALATLIVASLRPGPWTLAALVVIFAGSCYLLIYVNYAAFAVCLTAYVVSCSRSQGCQKTS